MNHLFVCLFCFLIAGTSTLHADPWIKHLVLEGAKSGINTVGTSDFDQDGHLDMITSFDAGVQVLKGPDFKTIHLACDLRAHIERLGKAASCIHSTLLDVDGDGDLDFCGSRTLVFWCECPDKPFEQPWTFRLIDDEIAGTHCLITGDVNRDGRLDLIANSFQGPDKTKVPHSITWLETPKNPATAKAWPRHVFANQDAPGGSHYMGFGDLNGDGRPDIACGAKGGKGFPNGEWFAWWEQGVDPSAAWKKHLLRANQPGASNIIPADVNGDEHTDLIASRGHGKGLLWFKGPDFPLLEIDTEFAFPHSLAVADLDQDGDQDIASCGSKVDGKVAWWENDGKGVFARHTIGGDQGSYDLRLVDLDRDGDLDVLIAGHGNRNIVWYENPLKK